MVRSAFLRPLRFHHFAFLETLSYPAPKHTVKPHIRTYSIVRNLLATMSTALPKEDQIKNLRKLFADSDVPNDPKAWDQAWIDSTTPWDASRPQPALVELLEGAHDADNKVADLKGNLVPVSQAIPKGDGTAVVPGCGRGYDAKVFAERGFTSYGVDISSNAVAAANKVSFAGGIFTEERIDLTDQNMCTCD